jgi:hypothetical protein
MANGSNGIRTIHDAIDAKVNRILSEIKRKREQREREINQSVYDSVGITKMQEEWERVTGRTPERYSWYDDDSTLGLALKEARKELEVFDNSINAIRLKAEDCHIQVVAGDKAEVLKDLDKSLNDAIKQLRSK